MDSLSHQFLLSLHAQLFWTGACGQNYRPCAVYSVAGCHLFDFPRKRHRQHLRETACRSKPLSPLAHFFTQGKTVNPFLKTGVIVNLPGKGHLASRRKFFQNHRVQPRPDCVESRRIPGRAAPDDNHIVNMALCTSFFCSVLCKKILILIQSHFRLLLLFYFWNTPIHASSIRSFLPGKPAKRMISFRLPAKRMPQNQPNAVFRGIPVPSRFYAYAFALSILLRISCI